MNNEKGRVRPMKKKYKKPKVFLSFSQIDDIFLTSENDMEKIEWNGEWDDISGDYWG